MRTLQKVLIYMTALLPLGAAFAAEKNSDAAEPTLLRAAIFVQNRAGKEFQDKLDTLNDMLSARLTEEGLSIIDKNDVIAKFRESRDSDEKLANTIKALTDLIKFEKTETTVESALSDASALRISQMIGADYLVIATINSSGQEKRKFKGKGTIVGTDSEVTIHTLRMAVKLLEGSQGGSVYGDLVTVNERVATFQNLETESSDIVNKLLDEGAEKIATNISGQLERIRAVQVKTVPTVEFSIKSNIDDVMVELDGAVIGSAPGRFNAAPGLHQMRIAKENFSTWEKTVNIFQNQVLSISLELSEEGARRYKDIEAFKQEMAQQKQDMELGKQTTEATISINKEQSAADAEAKRLIAEGEKKKREQSYIHDDGIGNEIKNIIHGGD